MYVMYWLDSIFGRFRLLDLWTRVRSLNLILLLFKSMSKLWFSYHIMSDDYEICPTNDSKCAYLCSKKKSCKLSLKWRVEWRKKLYSYILRHKLRTLVKTKIPACVIFHFYHSKFKMKKLFLIFSRRKLGCIILIEHKMHGNFSEKLLQYIYLLCTWGKPMKTKPCLRDGKRART